MLGNIFGIRIGWKIESVHKNKELQGANVSWIVLTSM